MSTKQIKSKKPIIHEDPKPKFKISTILIHIALILLVIINIFPLYWMLTFSLKSNDEIQGYSSTMPVTRWEEVDNTLNDVIGNMYTIQWGRIQDKVWSSVRTPLTTGGLFDTKEKVDELKTKFDNKWNSGLRDDIASIDGLLAEDKTEEDWENIYQQIERLAWDAMRYADEKITNNLYMDGDQDELDEEARIAFEERKDEMQVFALRSNAKKNIRKSIEGLIKLKDFDEETAWLGVKATIADVMGDQDFRLDQPRSVYIPPNHIGLPKSWKFSNYSEAMNTGNMGQYFINSLVVSASAIIITLVAAFMATYAMTRLVWKGRKMMNKFFMLGLTIPIHAALVPVYVIMSRMNMLNTYVALIIPYSAFSLSMAILISVGFMGDIPYDLDEAAFLDGCGVWGIFFRVIFPLMMPAVATVGIYTFLQCWNELLFATIFVHSGNYRTLPVGVQQLFGQYTTDWGPIGAALCIATLPTLIVYIALSKRIQAGFIAGAVKG